MTPVPTYTLGKDGAAWRGTGSGLNRIRQPRRDAGGVREFPGQNEHAMCEMCGTRKRMFVAILRKAQCSGVAAGAGTKSC